MFCVHCGKQLPDTANFCDGCGTPVRKEAPAAPEASYAAPVPQQAAPKSAGKKKEWILSAAVTALVVLLLAGLGIFLLGGKGEKAETSEKPGKSAKTELSYEELGEACIADHYSKDNWTYCSVTAYAAGEQMINTQTVNTSSAKNAAEVWDSICGMEMVEVPWQEDMWDLTAEQDWISAYFSCEAGTLSVIVLEEGLIMVSPSDGEKRAYLYGDAVYAALSRRLPQGSLSLEKVFSPDATDWDTLLIIYEDETDTQYAKVSTYSPRTIGEILDRLCRGKVGYGPLGYTFQSGCDSVRVIMDSEETGLISQSFNADGTGVAAVGGWNYGITDAHATYEILLEILAVYG